jgi:hypothetical protein
MPNSKKTLRSLKATRSLAVAGLLLAAGLQATISLHAQDTNLSTSAVSLTNFPHLGSGSLLPEAPEAVTDHGGTNRDMQSPSAYPGVQTTGDASSFPDFRQRARRFLLDFGGPTAFVAPAFEAGIDTARPLKAGYPSDGVLASGNHPAHGDVPEWGEGAQGYAKRYADRFGQGLVGTASRYALGEVLRQDVTYHRCQCTGLFTRTAHAFLGAYTAHTRSGRAIPSLPAVASPFIASEVAVAAWYPSRYDASDALRISVLNYVAAPFKNLLAEFITK